MNSEKIGLETASSGTESFESNFSVVSHPVSETVRTLFPAPIYGATYVEIAQYAFLKYFHESSLEIKQVTFFSPLAVHEAEMEVQTVVQKEADSLRFIVTSQSKLTEVEAEPVSFKYAEGVMYKTTPGAIVKYDLAALKKRLEPVKPGENPALNFNTHQISGLEVNSLYYGTSEILAEVTISRIYLEQSKGKVFHPSLYDWIVNTAIQWVKPGAFKPLYYQNLKRYGEIPEHFYLHVQKASSTSSDAVSFDILCLNGDQEIFFGLEDYNVSYTKDIYQTFQPRNKAENAAESPGTNPPKSGSPSGDFKKTGEKELIQNVSHLSWRQMNCIDRCLGLLIGGVKPELVNYYKLFLGARYGYRLEDFILAHFYHDRPPQNETVLDMFGIEMKFIKIPNLGDLSRTVMESIDTYGSVVTRFDEYYLFYSPHYLNGHTTHLTVINDHEKNKQRYSIIDTNQILENNGAEKINYGKFYTTFDTLNNCYRDLPDEERYILAIDKVDEGKILNPSAIKQLLIKLLHYLTQSRQPGKEIEMIRDILEKKKELLNTDTINSFYRILGGKELFILTLFDYFLGENGELSLPRELSKKTLGLSNNLINNYLAALYRGRELKMESTAALIHEIQDCSAGFFQAIIHTLESS